MSQQQKLNFRLLKALLLQLRAYGLNPTEWRVKREGSQSLKKFSIYNRFDQDFCFEGELKQSGSHLEWKNLALISL
jgi:hypothetical protein